MANSHLRFQRIGIIASVKFASQMARLQESNSDKALCDNPENAIALLQMAHESCSNHPASLAFFFDEMTTMVRQEYGIHGTVLDHMYTWAQNGIDPVRKQKKERKRERERP